MPTRIENETPLEKLARIREKTKLRARRYYGNHRQKVLDKRKDDWKKLKEECARQALANRNNLQPNEMLEYVPETYIPPVVEMQVNQPPTNDLPARATRSSKRIAALEPIQYVFQESLPKGRPKMTTTKKTKCKDKGKYTMEYIIEALKLLPEGSEGTIKTNIDDISTITNMTSPLLDCDWEKGLSKPLLIIDKLETAYKLNSNDKYSTNAKIKYLNLIMKIIDKIIPELIPIKDKYIHQSEILKQRSINEKEEYLVNVYRFDILKKKILEKFKKHSKEFLLASLYEQITVRDNFSQLKIINSMDDIIKDKKTNYLILPNNQTTFAKVFLQKYKTDKKYADLEFTCDKVLTDLLIEYINKESREY